MAEALTAMRPFSQNHAGVWSQPGGDDLYIKMAEAREENVYMAKLAEQAERYDEVIVLIFFSF